MKLWLLSHANNFKIHSLITEKSAKMFDNIVSQPTNWSTSQAANQQINQLRTYSTNRLTGPSTNRTINQSTNWSANKPTNWSTIKRAIMQQINPSINHLTNRSTLVETTQNQCELRTFLQKKSSTWTFFCGNFTFVEVESHIALVRTLCWCSGLVQAQKPPGQKTPGSSPSVWLLFLLFIFIFTEMSVFCFSFCLLFCYLVLWSFLRFPCKLCFKGSELLKFWWWPTWISVQAPCSTWLVVLCVFKVFCTF